MTEAPPVETAAPTVLKFDVWLHTRDSWGEDEFMGIRFVDESGKPVDRAGLTSRAYAPWPVDPTPLNVATWLRALADSCEKVTNDFPSHSLDQ